VHSCISLRNADVPIRITVISFCWLQTLDLWPEDLKEKFAVDEWFDYFPLFYCRLHPKELAICMH